MCLKEGRGGWRKSVSPAILSSVVWYPDVSFCLICIVFFLSPVEASSQHAPQRRPPKASERKARRDLRGQLGVVDQVFQRVTAAELVEQTGQVADDGGWVWRVNVAGNVADLNQGQVPVGVGPLSCRHLRRTAPVCGTAPSRDYFTGPLVY